MRVPTFNTSQNAFAAIEARQAEQAKLQIQLGTTLRVNSPGDDPVAAAQAELARSHLARIAQDQRSTQLATSVLSAADASLGIGVDLLQSVRESLVAAGDGSYSAPDRAALALQLRDARDRLQALANTRDGAGGYVFAGQGSAGDPLAGGASPTWSAAGGVQRIGAGGQFAATVDGNATFMALPQGNGVFTTASAPANTGTGWIDAGAVANPAQLTGHGYSIAVGGTPGALTCTVADTTAGTTLASAVPYVDGATIAIDGQNVKVSGTPAAGDSFQLAPSGRQSVFQTLDDAIATLEAPYTPSTYAQGLQRSQANLDRALDGMILMRSRVGTEMQRVDGASAIGEQDKLQATQRRSNLEDLDFAAALSQQQNGQTALQAALKTYAGVAQTSLFQLLN